LTSGGDPSGRYWRILSPRWSHAPLSGDGAARHGGRWNRPGQPTLYLSEQIETAFAEYQQELGVRPGTFVAYDVAGGSVADLGDPVVLESLQVDPASLLGPWKEMAWVKLETPPTWLMRDSLEAAAVDGVRVPSARYAGGFNLVLWRWNAASAPRVTANDPLEELGRGRRTRRRARSS
jgi:RES domain-containing protein